MPMLMLYVLQCDDCEDMSSALHGGIYTRAEAWKVRQAEGWVRYQSGMGLTYRCPGCSAFIDKAAAGLLKKYKKAVQA